MSPFQNQTISLWLESHHCNQLSDLKPMGNASHFPLYRNTPKWRVFELVGVFGAKVPIFVDSACEQVLHQAGLDALLFGDQRFGLVNRLINR